MFTVRSARSRAAIRFVISTILFTAESSGQKNDLEGDDKWNCPRCKCKAKATKKLELFHVPEVLVSHLKRFGCANRTSAKLETPVDFLLEGWDVTPHLESCQVLH